MKIKPWMMMTCFVIMVAAILMGGYIVIDGFSYPEFQGCAYNHSQEPDEKLWDFYYSPKMKAQLSGRRSVNNVVYIVGRRKKPIFVVINGVAYEYTLCVDHGKPAYGSWDDYIFVGTAPSSYVFIMNRFTAL